MFDFFYDSLDTLRRVKKPSLKEVTELTIIIFIVVILSALIFALMDGVFGEAYQMFFESMSS